MPTMLSDDGGLTGNAKIDAALKQAKGNAHKAYGDAKGVASNVADSAKQKAAELSVHARGFIGQRPYTSIIATFALGLFFGAMAASGGK